VRAIAFLLWHVAKDANGHLTLGIADSRAVGVYAVSAGQRGDLIAEAQASEISDFSKSAGFRRFLPPHSH
jgi:hypothetical protein